MGFNGTVGLSAERRVAGGGQLLVASSASRRTPTTSGRCGRGRPHPELEFTLYAPATSGAQGGQDTAGRRLIFLLMKLPLIDNQHPNLD